MLMRCTFDAISVTLAMRSPFWRDHWEHWARAPGGGFRYRKPLARATREILSDLEAVALLTPEVKRLRLVVPLIRDAASGSWQRGKRRSHPCLCAGDFLGHGYVLFGRVAGGEAAAEEFESIGG